MKYEIVEVGDQEKLIPTSSFPHAHFPFEFFNVIQSRVFEFYEEPANILVAASTSAGKTIIAEQYLSHEVRVRGGKGMYLAPFKSLSQEKIDDWTDKSHHFSDLKLSICSGDYRLTADRKKELAEANVVLFTSEMLNSRCRNHQSENNTFLEEVNTAVFDEIHLICDESRGSHIEAGIMKLTDLNPHCRIVGLSATMPNVAQLAEWLSSLTKRKTYVLTSNYRPVPLHVHYETFPDHLWKYEAKEQSKVDTAIDFVLRHDQDKFLLFAHTKRTGELMVKKLRQFDIECEFHNADLDKAKRIKLEHRFRNDPKFRVIVATSTLGTGVNLPARRTALLGLHRGLKPLRHYEIGQLTGRAGRPKYDTRGDAYILLPKKEKQKWIDYINTPEPIISQMLDKSGSHKVLAFHLVSEIHHGGVKTVEDIHRWYSRSLAAFQDCQLSDAVVDKMITALVNRGIIFENPIGELEVTSVGRIASMFYYSPFDVADLKKNFCALFDSGKEMDDHWIAMTLANIESHRAGIVSNAEREQISVFDNKVSAQQIKSILGNSGVFVDAAKKIGFCYYSLLNGTTNPVLAAITRGLQFDFSRLAEVLFALDGMLKWEQKDYMADLSRRVLYGVDWTLLELCRLPGIGKVKARKLWEANLKTLDRVIEKPNLVKIALGCSDTKVEEICQSAARMLNEKK